MLPALMLVWSIQGKLVNNLYTALVKDFSSSFVDKVMLMMDLITNL